MIIWLKSLIVRLLPKSGPFSYPNYRALKRFLYREEAYRFRNFRTIPQLHLMRVQHDAVRRNLAHELRAEYPAISRDNSQKRNLKDQERKIFSQNGEDGIILHILSRIGVETRLGIEIGAGGFSSNLANLGAYFDWKIVFLDGSKDDLERMDGYIFGSVSNLDRSRIGFHQAWLTRGNIVSTLDTLRDGEIPDVISIDVDGNDYWLWECLEDLAPRLVIMEYNAVFGDTERLTTPYADDFSRDTFHPSTKICGASLAALAELGKRKGYVLIGCESNGVNAFFVRRDLAEGVFDELTPKEAFYDHFQWYRHYDTLRPQLASLPLDKV